jgi:hypothetical protein
VKGANVTVRLSSFKSAYFKQKAEADNPLNPDHLKESQNKPK